MGYEYLVASSWQATKSDRSKDVHGYPVDMNRADTATMAKHLNAYAADGWELINVIWVPATGGSWAELLHYFRRPVPDS